MTDTMRVVAVGADGSSVIENRPVPAPAAGELLLRVRSCGLCGTDLFKIVNGTAPAGTVLGHELVGDVLSTGAGVTGFAIGQRVVVPHHVACGQCALCRRGADTQCAAFRDTLLEPGGFAETVLVRRRAVVLAAQPVPDDIPDEAAVFMEPAACVLRGIDRAELPRARGTAVILGAGSMGLVHLLVLRAAEPGLAVIVSDPLEERRTVARRHGATAVVDPGDLADAVGEISHGIGADAVFDTVGGPQTLGQALEMLRPGGTAVLFAHAPGGALAGFELNPFFKAEKRIIGTYSGGLNEQKRIAALLFSGKLDPSPLVTHRMPLERFDEAVELARSRKALKILITPGNA